MIEAIIASPRDGSEIRLKELGNGDMIADGEGSALIELSFEPADPDAEFAYEPIAMRHTADMMAAIAQSGCDAAKRIREQRQILGFKAIKGRNLDTLKITYDISYKP